MKMKNSNYISILEWLEELKERELKKDSNHIMLHIKSDWKFIEYKSGYVISKQFYNNVFKYRGSIEKELNVCLYFYGMNTVEIEW